MFPQSGERQQQGRTMENSIKAWIPRVSLREFLALVAFVALACGALLNASATVATAMLGVTVLIVIGLAIIAAVDRGPRQAAALGGLVAMLVYGVAWNYEPKLKLKSDWNHVHGMDQVVDYAGHLPTSKLLHVLWTLTSATYMVDPESGRVVEKMSDSYPQFTSQVASSHVPSGWAGGPLRYEGRPRPDAFMPVGHCLSALLIGYLGGKFAVWVYRRRVARGGSQAG
jgi:hypothetical protein